MLAKALIFIVFAVHFAYLTPKGKYFIIKTQVSGEVGEPDGGRHDYINPEENPLKPMMTKEGKNCKFSH